jgi:vancomycin permeability regulator SanA
MTASTRRITPARSGIRSGGPPSPFALLRLVAGLLAAGVIALVGLRLYTLTRYHDQIVAAEAVPAGSVAVVFGAAVRLDGEPTSVLYDRVAEAASLYREGRVERLILSGDGRDRVLDEPAAMRRAAVRLGVPERDLVLDGAGFRTQETCRNAAELAGGAPVVLVTQRFHLTRALLLCEAAGLSAVGVASDQRT